MANPRKSINKAVLNLINTRHGPAITALGAGISFFALIGSGFDVANNTSGEVFLYVLLASLVFTYIISTIAYEIRLSFLNTVRKSTTCHEVRKELFLLTQSLEEKEKQEITQLFDAQEEQIEKLQNDIIESKNREIPGEPILIREGIFKMGDMATDEDASPSHDVFLESFLIDPYPITKKQFNDFLSCPNNHIWLPDAVYERYKVPYMLCDWLDIGDGQVAPPTLEWDHPVVNINWFAAVAFCNWRSLQANVEPVYSFVSDQNVSANFSKKGWRLPTEAEWEMAARGGRNGSLPWDGKLNQGNANYGKHFRGTTPVGRFIHNDYKLYDVLGNVKEWCHDWYQEDIYANRKNSPTKNPTGPQGGKAKVFRGGSWLDRANWITVNKRGQLPPINTNPDFGFRCVQKP